MWLFLNRKILGTAGPSVLTANFPVGHISLSIQESKLVVIEVRRQLVQTDAAQINGVILDFSQRGIKKGCLFMLYLSDCNTIQHGGTNSLMST